ncbi:MAG: type IV pilin N-terminal domain-containing protein [Candidatus Poseidoniia archaeon]|nr:type IV pilin N-terminal domain-containing protein [Candidatus Poseidoniia archaeon]
MEHRIEQDNEGVSPVIAVILMVAITVVLAAVLYVWAASFLEQGDTSPFAQFTSTKNSSGDYYVTVVKVSTKYDLEAFSYFLKDSTGTTNEFGEVAMQNLSGNVVGVDVSYDATCGDSCDADLQTRSDAVDADDGALYAVTFNDNDRDGKLSAGDKFTARGNGHSSNGPAEDEWSLEVKFDNTGDVIGSKRLG